MKRENLQILVIDGQGGQMGSQIIREIRGHFTNVDILAVGTNATAAAAMLKAGAKQAASGENPVMVACRRADVIIGPIGIVIADALLGEVTAAMAAAVGRADAIRILLPVNKCENIVAGVADLSTSQLIRDVIRQLEKIVEESVGRYK